MSTPIERTAGADAHLGRRAMDIRMLGRDEMIREIGKRKEPALDIARALKRRPSNLTDYYYRELLKLSEKGYFFEMWMVINWIGAEAAPTRILEIGTRGGGSLIAMLKPYKDYAGVKAVCFDIWEEIVGSPRKVLSNMKYMGIPRDVVVFRSEDSKETVPKYLSEHTGEMFDYVLVDGGHDHKTADTDLRNVEERVAPGGFLVFDDLVSYSLLAEWESFKKRNGDKFLYFEVMHRKGIAWAIRREG